MNTNNFQCFAIDHEIIKALNALNYTIPTEVQAKVIPLALEQKDLIIKSQTGSGKTAAYAIPLCESVAWLENKPQALVLTPTRELAVQVQEELTNIGRFKRIKASAIYGRHPFSLEKTELKQKTHIVVGTPGRVMDHIKKGTLNLTKIRYLIIDEADRMLDMGFIAQVEEILQALSEDRVTMLFSATMPDEILHISSKHMKHPLHIDISEDDITTTDITHSYYPTTEQDKFALLTDVLIMENPDSCIIFCSTKERVDMVCNRLENLGYATDKLHGGMEQSHRLRSINRFKRGSYRYLVATDVAARGIDVECISLVINYDFPSHEENYVHRTGRTGRAGQKGKAISFLESKQNRYLHFVEKLIGFEIQRKVCPSCEEVAAQKPFFDAKITQAPPRKEEKSQQLNKEIMKLRFSGGKKKKLRATNFVGVISNLEGVSAEDIGIITIQDTLTYVEILNGKGSQVLNAMQHTMICGKLLKVIKVKAK